MGGRRYAVLGAGRQGKAAAYDLAKFGNTSEVLIADRDAHAAADAEIELNALLGAKIVRSLRFDASDLTEVWHTLYGVDGFVSAMHFDLNLMLTKFAINAGCHMVDLGGNTAVVLNQHELDRSAASVGVSIIPDCGMAPGFDVNLACYVLSRIAHARKIVIYCGGIPQCPIFPLGYHFPFFIKGLVNECSGEADIIRDGKVVKQACLGPVELVQVPTIGMLEATHTSGGISTAPWMLNKKYPGLETFEYKTLRYPGHWKILQDLAARGELESGLDALAKNTPPDNKDLGIIEVRGEGFDGHGAAITRIVEVIDHYDEDTGFTAMQRLTGFHASIMLIAATETLEGGGVYGVESIDPNMVIAEFAKRGIAIQETHAVVQK